ncbi:hypothetical protein DIPPA_18554, partial [Diplonema papillatum]
AIAAVSDGSPRPVPAEAPRPKAAGGGAAAAAVADLRSEQRRLFDVAHQLAAAAFAAANGRLLVEGPPERAAAGHRARAEEHPERRTRPHRGTVERTRGHPPADQPFRPRETPPPPGFHPANRQLETQLWQSPGPPRDTERVGFPAAAGSPAAIAGSRPAQRLWSRGQLASPVPPAAQSPSPARFACPTQCAQILHFERVACGAAAAQQGCMQCSPCRARLAAAAEDRRRRRGLRRREAERAAELRTEERRAVRCVLLEKDRMLDRHWDEVLAPYLGGDRRSGARENGRWESLSPIPLRHLSPQAP